MKDPQPLAPPCPHTKRGLELLAEGKSGGLYLWYVKLHALRCNQCRAALEALKRYFTALRHRDTEPVDDSARLNTLLDSLDNSSLPPS